MTKIEKGILGVLAMLCILLIINVINISNSIDEAGGMKQLIIDAGREIKEINEEINKD